MRLLLAFLLACPLARADSLTDLKTRLAEVAPREPVSATVTLEYARESGGEKSGPARASVRADDAAGGLTLHWARADLAQLDGGGRAPGKGRTMGSAMGAAMNALGVTTVADLLDAAPSLGRALDRAELIEEKSAEWQGRPAKLLVLKIDPALSEKDRKYVKELTVEGRLWLDADGWPLAAERSQELKGRAMLVINFEQHEKEEFRFERVSDRLVTVYHLKETAGSGAGEKGSERYVATVRIEKS